MSVDHLRTFLAVAEQKSFTAAAKILNLSQPAVSHHIQTLEKLYAVSLFYRHHKSIALTEAGTILYQHAVELLQLHDKITQTMLDTSQNRPVKIGSSFTIGEHFLPHILANFFSSHKNISPDCIQLVIGTTQAISEKLYNEEIQIALVEGERSSHPFVKEIFFEDEVVLAASKTTSLSQSNKFDRKQLLQATWIVREPGCSLRKATERFWECLGIAPAPSQIFEFHNNQLIKASVKNGLGLAVLSKSSIQQELADGELVILDYCPEPIRRPFFLMRKHPVFASNKEKLFWNHVLIHGALPTN